MRSARYFSQACLLMLIAMLCAASVFAADDDDYRDEYDVTARVARISLLRGEVNLRRAGDKEWEQARLNFPLVEGDTLATGSDARLEIQIDSRNFVRVAADSVIRIVTLRDEGVALSLSEGTATLRLARFDHGHEYFEIDAPKTTLAAETRGLYRLDISRDGGVQISARDGGRARIYSETSGFALRDGHSATLVYDGAEEGDWHLSYAPASDNWDEWVNDRERYLASNLRYDQRTRYYDADVWGAEELDSYGDWAYAGDYGWVWRPRVTVINNYNNWAPYRYGRWTWCPPYGWTWVGDEPWGWAPYHYGRWVYYNDSWCWAPRGYGYHYNRAYWRPALVAFVYLPTSYGEQVAWYPLTYGQHDPHSRRYQQSKPERLTPLRSNEVARLERINPAALRAVTTAPARSFGLDNVRLQPATTELARRAVTGEPVRGRLPIAPANASGNTTGGATVSATERPTRSSGAARPASLVPSATLSERPTGAAARRPGAALDDELRRTRLYNNREPRELNGAVERNGASAAPGDARERDTGALTRPARPARSSTQVERPNTRSDGNERQPAERRPMPERRERPVDPQYEPPSSRPSQSPGRVNAPVRPADERPDESERPTRPARREPVERPAPSERPERRERQERNEPQPSRAEPPQRSEPQRSEPPSRPEPRNEPPPQREQQPAPARAPEPERHAEPPRERERNEAPAHPSHPAAKGRGEP